MVDRPRCIANRGVTTGFQLVVVRLRANLPLRLNSEFVTNRQSAACLYFFY